MHGIAPAVGHGAEEPIAARLEALVGGLDVEHQRDAAPLVQQLPDLVRGDGLEADDARVEAEGAVPVGLEHVGDELRVVA